MVINKSTFCCYKKIYKQVLVMKKNKFIVLEGGEGSGKTTQLKLLYLAFAKHNISATLTREPGGVKSSEFIRKCILDCDLDSKTDILLFIASRRENLLHNILPQLEKNDYVLCDRFLLSTIVYQCILNNISIDDVLELHLKYNFNLFPQLTIILNLDPSIANKRLLSRGNLSKIDKKSLEFHSKVYLAYSKSYDGYKSKSIYIQADNNVLNIHKQIVNEINKEFCLNLQPLNKQEIINDGK